MPKLLQVVEQLQTLDQNGVLRDHVEQGTKLLELSRQRSAGGVTQYSGSVDYILRKL